MIIKKGYIYSADVIRTIAIICVVTIHIASSFVNYPPYFGGISWWFANYVNSAARVAVPLFVMLSGFLLLHRKGENGGVDIKKRLLRIILPMILWNFIYFLWPHFYWERPYNLNGTLTSLLTGGTYYHLYYLYVVLGLYIVTPILHSYMIHASQSNVKNWCIGLFIFSALITVFNYLVPSVATNFNSFTLFIPYISYYLAGGYFRKYPVKLKPRRAGLFFLLYLGLVIATGILNHWNMKLLNWNNYFQPNAQYARYFYENFAPNIIAMSVLLFTILSHAEELLPVVKNKAIKILVTQLSVASFGIYLIHPIIIDLITGYTSLNLGKIGQLIWLCLIIMILLTLLMSYIVLAAVKKIVPRMKIIY